MICFATVYLICDVYKFYIQPNIFSDYLRANMHQKGVLFQEQVLIEKY